MTHLPPSISRYSRRQRLSRFFVALSVLLASSGVLVFDNQAGAVSSGSPKTVVAFLNSDGQTTNSVNLQQQSPNYLLVRVANSGTGASKAKSSPTLNLSVPAGTSIESVQSINATTESTVSGTWNCASLSSTSQQCSFVNSLSQPQEIAAGTQTIAAVSLQTSDARQSNGKTIQATAQLPGASSVSTQASVAVAPPAVGLALSVTGPSQVHNGQSTQIAYQVRNDGTVDATAFTAGRSITPAVALSPSQAMQMSWFSGATLTPAVSLSNLLPARRFSSWSSNSAGWICSGSQLQAPSCSLTASRLAVGETAPPLIIRFTLAQGQAGTTPAAMAGSVVPWTVAIAQSMNGMVARSTQSQQLLVVPRPAGKLSVHLTPVTSSMVTSGQSVNFAVNHTAIDGFARGIVDTLTIPNGLTTSPVNAGGWSCPAGSGTVKCTFSGVVPPGGTPSYVITINAADSAPSGAHLITVNSSGNFGEATATDMQPIFVVNIGGARLVLKRLLNSTSTTAVTDGKPLAMIPGLATEAPFSVTNTGNRALAKGAVISVTAALTPAAAAYVRANPLSNVDAIQILLPPPIPGGPICSLNQSNFSATCTLTLTSPLNVNSQSPAFTFKPVLNKALESSVLAQVPSQLRHLLEQGELFTVTASVTNNPDVIAPVTLDVRTASSTLDVPDLQPSIQTSSLKLGAAPSTVSLLLKNFGGAANASVVTFTIPSSLQASAVAGSSCAVSPPASGGSSQTVTCSVPALEAGSDQTPSTSASIPFKLANVSATNNVSVSASVAVGGKVATSTQVQIPIDANPALTLSTPGNVQVQPTSRAGELDVKFTPSSNAPSGQQYFAKACLNSAMTSSCVTRNVTSVSLLPGLAAGTRYYVTVTAAASGNYVASTSVPVSAVTGTAVGPLPIDPAPGEVTGLSATALSTTSVVLNWSAPTRVGTGITGYTVNCEPSCTIANQPGANDTSLTISGLTPGALYFFTVAADASDGQASAVSSTSVTTLTSTPGGVSYLNATAQSTTSVVLHWVTPDHVGAGISGYTVTCTPSCTIANQPGAGDTSLTITGLTPGTSYTFSVVTNATDNEVSAAHSTSATTLFVAPDSVTGASASPVGMTEAHLTWTAPAQVGAGISGYTVTCTPSCTIANQPGAGDTSLTITGLTRGTSYTFSIIANSIDGQQSSAVTTSSVTTSANPGQVTNSVVTNVTSSGATISWQPPLGSGDAISGYVVSCNPACGSPKTLSASQTSVTLTGLLANTNYTVSIVAKSTGMTQTASTKTFRTAGLAPTGALEIATDSQDLNEGSANAAASSAPTTTVAPQLTKPALRAEPPIVSLTTPSAPAPNAAQRSFGTAAMTGVPPSTGSNFRTICDNASASIGGGSTSLTADLGGLIAVSITGLTVTGSCASGATVSFTGASFNLYGIYSASVGAGSISSSGFTINAGSLTTPANWPGGAMTLPSTGPISLPFSASTLASSVSFQGSFSLGGLFGLPLPSGWTAQTTISFSYSNSVVGIGISSTAGPSGSGLTISGSADTSGNFSVSVSGNMSLAGVTISGVSASWASGSPFVFAGTISIGGSTLAVSGSYTDTSTWTFSANGSTSIFGTTVAASGSIVSTSGIVSGSYTMSLNNLTVATGMTVNSLTMSWSPSGGLTGSGALVLGGTTLNLAGSYTNNSNWSFDANGSLSLFGSTVTASGTVSKSSGSMTGSYTMAMNNLAVASGMTINSLTMSWSPSGGLTGSGALVLGGTTLNLAGSYTNNSNWSFDANGSLSLFGSAVTASGTVSKSSGSMTGSYTMSMGTVSIASGLSVSGMTMSWSSGNGLTGSGTIAIGSLQVTINASYTDSNNYTFTATTNGSGSITILPGVSISGAAFTGTISKSSGVLNWNMSVSFSSITLISNLATLVNPVFTISNFCPESLSASQCPTGNTQYFSATGTLRMNLGTGLGSQDVALTGVYGVQTGGFELSATFSNITVISGILTVSSPTISLSYNRGKTVSTGAISGVGDGTVNGYTISISGTVNLDIPGFSQSVPVLLTYRPAGTGFDFTLTSDFPSVGTLGSTGAALASLVYTSASTSISLNGLNVTVPANTLVFGGEFVLPDWMATYLGGTLQNVALYATYTNAASYSVSGVFQTNLPLPTGSPDFSFSITSFSVSLSMSTLGYKQSLAATGTFTISGSAGNAVIDVTLGMGYQLATQEITGSITATATQGYLWNDAFGLPGVNLQAFAIQVGIVLGTTPIPLPSLGLAADIVITGSLASNLGIVSGTPISAVLNLSATNPCLDVQIGTSGGPVAISIGGGLITATYAHLLLAPDGCTVGTYVVQPGYQYDFVGSFFGVSIEQSMRVTINPTDPQKIDFYGVTKIGAFNIDGFLNFSGAEVTVAYTPTSFFCGFSGQATILGTSVLMAGSVSYDQIELSSTLSLTASISSFNVYGFPLQDLTLGVEYTQTPDDVSFSLSAAGTMSILGNLIPFDSSTGTISTSGFGTASFAPQTGASASGQVNFTFANGTVDSISIQVATGISVGSVLSINGQFSLFASTSSGAFVLSATGKVNVGTFTMAIAGCPNNQPGLTISNTGFNLCAATLDNGFFSATIAGAFYWSAPSAGTTITNASGQAVQAQANDFNFAATNVSMSVAGFGVFGSVNIGNVGGVTFAKVATSIGLSNTSSDSLVQISGSFDSQGNFSFTGSGGVKLAAINFTLAVTAAAQGSNMSVTADTNLMIAGSGFALTGTFTKVSTGVKTTMSITSGMTISGFNLGTTTVTVFVQPGTEYVLVTNSLSLGGIFSSYLNGTLGAVNGEAVFNFTLTSGINIPGVSVSGNLKLSNCGNASCTSVGTFAASVSGQFKDFHGFSYSFSSVSVNSNWSFSVSSSGSTTSCSDWTSFGVVRFKACFSGTYSVTLSTSSPNVAFSIGSNVAVERSIWVVTVSCSGKWYNPRSWRCSVSAAWGASRPLVSIGGTVDSNGNVRSSFNGIVWRFKV
ncbi:Fibronectin type III [Acidimicrobiia bacterium]